MAVESNIRSLKTAHDRIGESWRVVRDACKEQSAASSMWRRRSELVASRADRYGELFGQYNSCVLRLAGCTYPSATRSTVAVSRFEPVGKLLTMDFKAGAALSLADDIDLKDWAQTWLCPIA